MQGTNPNDGNHLLPDVIPAFFRGRASGFDRNDTSSFAWISIGHAARSIRFTKKRERENSRESDIDSHWG